MILWLRLSQFEKRLACAWLVSHTLHQVSVNWMTQRCNIQYEMLETTDLSKPANKFCNNNSSELLLSSKFSNNSYLYYVGVYVVCVPCVCVWCVVWLLAVPPKIPPPATNECNMVSYYVVITYPKEMPVAKRHQSWSHISFFNHNNRLNIIHFAYFKFAKSKKTKINNTPYKFQIDFISWWTHLKKKKMKLKTAFFLNNFCR